MGVEWLCHLTENINMLNSPITPQALIQEISMELLERPDVPTAILAGHQILSKSGEYSEFLGKFPEATWEMGMGIVKAVKEKMERIQIFTVINDWAELRGLDNPEEAREIYWDDARFELSETNDPLLAPHILPAIGYEGRITKGRFSEKALQNRFTKLFPRQPAACESPSCEYSFNKCSSEVVMLTRELYRSGIRRLIAFMPNICINPISYASHAIADGEFRRDDEIFAEEFQMKNLFLQSFRPQSMQEVLSKYEEQNVAIVPA
jgi:hypothetical protein